MSETFPKYLFYLFLSLLTFTCLLFFSLYYFFQFEVFLSINPIHKLLSFWSWEGEIDVVLLHWGGRNVSGWVIFGWKPGKSSKFRPIHPRNFDWSSWEWSEKKNQNQNFFKKAESKNWDFQNCQYSKYPVWGIVVDKSHQEKP